MRDETSKELDSSGDPPLAGPFVVVPASVPGEEELPALAALCEERSWSEKNIASALADKSAFHFLLRRAGDGTLCSFVLARFVIDVLDIDKVGTHPDFRRRGCARILIRHALREAKKRGGKVAFLEVRAGNTAARECYQSVGFQVDSVRKGYYNAGEDAIVMKKILTDDE
jgi:ribosomal-protein-alanine acetyltransferase